MPARRVVSKLKSQKLLVKCRSMVGTGTTCLKVRPRDSEKLICVSFDPAVQRSVMFIEEEKIRGL